MNLKLKNLFFIAAFTMLTQTSCAFAVLGAGGAVGYGAAQERTLGSALDDAAIEAALNAKYLNSKDKELFMDVDMDSVEGRVLLTGDVPTQQAKIDAYNLAWETKGVKEVINEIEVNSSAQFSAREVASDAWISTQIESRLLFTKNISSMNYSVETIKGVVYLMGVAEDRTELENVTYIASQVRGVQKVVSYVRIKGQNGITQTRSASSTGSVSDEPLGTVPGSIRASSSSQNYSTDSSSTGSSGKLAPIPESGDIIIEDSPNMQ